MRESTEQLIGVVQELSMARDLTAIMDIVRHAARELTGADGATFVLRDDGMCYYAEEDAIGPLWKGKRFPMSACISGWAMLNKKPAVIEDIFSDPRVPVDAYKPTFVKSLVMVPIRTEDPVGAIGNYWARHYEASPEEVKILQALADSTSIAMENVNLYQELEKRVEERTQQLKAANEELEAFTYSVSHDLRAPLRHIKGYCRLLLDSKEPNFDEEEHETLQKINRAAENMNQLIEDLLKLSKITGTEISKSSVDLSSMAREIFSKLKEESSEREVEISIEPDLITQGDPNLLHIALENLLSNAWKYTSKEPKARITFGCRQGDNEKKVYYVKDNGAGFDMEHAGNLFGPFQRLHPESEFQGTGIGLATVQRIIHKHGGRIWAEAIEGEGATFSFTLNPGDLQPG